MISPRPRRDERGSITPFVVIVSLAIIMLAALVIDGGRQLNAKGRAIAYAQEAARAGAQAVDLQTPNLDLDDSNALRAARAYCDRAKAADSQLVQCTAEITQVNDDRGSYKAVTVRARVDVPAILLGIINRPVLQASGGALARPVTGITEADSGKVATLGPPSLAPPSAGQPTGTAPPRPPESEVTPCTPRDEDDKDKDKDKDEKDKDKEDDDKPPTCKTPDVPGQ
ncbi:MAG: Tad domain-containing protein [Aeromicrobium erythreum]